MAHEAETAGGSQLSRLAGDMTARPCRALALPGDRFAAADVALWCLTDYETREAQLEAVKYLRDVLKYADAQLMTDTWVADAEFKTQVLFRALRDGKRPVQAFAGSPNELRTLLYPDEREAFYAEYLKYVDDRSPMRRLHSAEEVDELVSALGKASPGRETALSFYDSASLRSIALSLASRCEELMRRPLSATSPSSDTSISSSPTPAGVS